MQKVDLTLLVDYRIGYGALAYLRMMQRDGFVPKKIIRLAFTRAKMVRTLSKYLNTKTAYAIFDIYRSWKMHEKAKKIRKLKSEICRNIGCDESFFDKLDLSSQPYEIETLYIDSYKDERLIEYIEKEETKTFLYASGGIVPAEVLDLEGVKIIHIHPGIVPDIKGSDGFFYSMLLKGKPGYSCFYMNEGIDTGEIIYSREFDFDGIKLSIDYDEDVLYEAILSFVDSYYRSLTLLDIVKKHHSLSNLPAQKQDPNDGTTYFTMHKKMVASVLEKCILK